MFLAYLAVNILVLVFQCWDGEADVTVWTRKCLYRSHPSQTHFGFISLSPILLFHMFWSFFCISCSYCCSIFFFFCGKLKTKQPAKRMVILYISLLFSAYWGEQCFQHYFYTACFTKKLLLLFRSRLLLFLSRQLYCTNLSSAATVHAVHRADII